MKMVKCVNGHYYDREEYIECPHCKKRYIYTSQREEKFFNIYLPQYSGEQVYCCVMHHPRRTAWITPTSYPVDYLYICYSDLLKEQCVYDTEKEKWSVILNNMYRVQKDTPEVINIQAKWDEKISYHLPMCDAMESWDFIFSRTPINVDRYLEGYVHQYGNKYAFEKDLMEENKRNEDFMKSLRKSAYEKEQNKRNENFMKPVKKNDEVDFNKICPYCMHQIRDDGICYYCKKNPKEMPVVSHQLRPFTILQGKYLVGNILGEGRLEFIYMGLDINLKVPVVIKEFYPNGFVTRESSMTSVVTIDSSVDADVVKKWKEDFLRKANQFARFAYLSSVVYAKDYFQENNTAYIVQEYLEGEDLKNYIKSKSGRISIEELIGNMKQVIKDLHEVHKQGFIYGDICPDNIFVLKNGKLKVLGFDTMRNLREENEKNKSVLLRPGYSPEEQYRTIGVQGPWTDVYALCATMYKCITGVTPIEAFDRLRQDEDKMKWPSEMGISINANLENALKKGMAILAENRIQDMQQLYDAIYLKSIDYTEKCGNCHKILEDEDKYCRYCGTKRGEGKFEPEQNIIQCVYGPMPGKRVRKFWKLFK